MRADERYRLTLSSDTLKRCGSMNDTERSLADIIKTLRTLML